MEHFSFWALPLNQVRDAGARERDMVSLSLLALATFPTFCNFLCTRGRAQRTSMSMIKLSVGQR